MNGVLKDMVISESGESAFRRKAIEMGMQTLQANGFLKVRDGVTTVEEVMSVSPLE